jgi:hypothetical protein
VQGVEWQDEPNGFTHDLRDFRRDEQYGESLLEWQARMVGVKVSDDPWLQVNPSSISNSRTVIARSGRYQNAAFPWAEVMREHPTVLFVGAEDEHRAFVKEFGQVEYCPTKDLLTLAEVILGAELFIGNQSCPFWIAAGLGVSLIQEMWMEAPNSIVPRKNARYLRRGPLHPIKSKRPNPPRIKIISGGAPSIICVFSFCASDRAMALEIARHIEAMGGVTKHRCIVLHPSNVDGREIIRHLESAFGEVRIVAYRPYLHGWPGGPNQCFYEAAKAVLEMPGNAPWLFMEADCVPTNPTWLDEIASEHQLCEQPILGVFNDTFDANGRVVGQNIEGVAVYPRDLLKRCAQLRTIIDSTEQYLRWGAVPPSFNTYIGPYTTKICAPATTIAHYWKSHSYKLWEDGIVRCRFKIPYGADDEVDMNAALVHGAKDFSLLDLVQGRLAAA